MGRYEAIGGTSPLTERTRAQVEGVAAALDGRGPRGVLVRYGAKYTAPTIEEGMAELVDAGVDRVVAIVLTPHQSSLGSGEYLRRAEEAAAWRPTSGDVDPRALVAPGPGPGRAAGRTHRGRAGLDRRPGTARRTAVFFTAHSLPEPGPGRR